jgi:hemerythrin-like domain-containing protein
MSRIASPIDVSLCNYMIQRHRDLEQRYCQLLEALAANAPDMRELWNELERGLLAHMEAEERFVLPAFARSNLEQAVELLRDHGRIREHLLELGIAIDLHLLRYERSADLVELLRSHGRREDQLLYQWADKQLDTELAKAAMQHASLR